VANGNGAGHRPLTTVEVRGKQHQAEEGEKPVSSITGQDLRASDADRDAVVSDLGEHFQAGRLTADELDERTGRALTARTWGELRAVLADLPATRPAPSPVMSRRAAPPVPTVLAGLAVVALVLLVAGAGRGLIWLLVPALLIARRSMCSSGH
jgi:Domain of unknown function (DUF1707)